MSKAKILKSKTFVKVFFEDNNIAFLDPLETEAFENFDFALMHCQNDCVCEDHIPTDFDFYFKLVGERNKSYTGKGNCLEPQFFLNGDKTSKWDIFVDTFFTSTPPNGHYILASYCPSSLEDGELYGDNLIHTSDGVVEVKKDNFLLNKDGELSSVEPEDVLSIFSKRKVKVSPSFKELRISNSRTRPARAAVGTLIYNQTTGQLEFKGKNGWERIITENLK